MSSTQRIGMFLVLVGLFIGSVVLDVWSSAEARLEDFRLGLSNRTPSGSIVFVDIDAESLSRMGVWPWPRSIHAEALDRLMALGAYEVAFDIDFSTESDPENDARFAAALDQAGGYAWLATFVQQAADGSIIVNRPHPLFASGRPAHVNITMDELGRAIAAPATIENEPSPSLAQALSPQASLPSRLFIDFSINLHQIDRIPIWQLLNNAVDPARIRDKQVIVGASAIELRDIFTVPRFGTIPGPFVQIAAAETARQDRALSVLGPWPALAAIGGLILMLSRFAGANWRMWLAGLLASLIGLETLAVAMLAGLGQQFETVPAMAAMGLATIVRLIVDFRKNRQAVLSQRARIAFLAAHDPATGAFSQPAMLEKLNDAIGHNQVVHFYLWSFERHDVLAANLGFELAEATMVEACQRLEEAFAGDIARLEVNLFAAMSTEPLPQDRLASILLRLDQPYLLEGHHLLLDTRWASSAVTENDLAGAVLMRQARIALAEAKRRKVKGLAYVPTFSGDLARRQEIDLAIRSAAEKGELAVAYQAQVDAASGLTIGFEALLRWHSPLLGEVSPAEFIPIAEENGAIVGLGQWVLREACRVALAEGWTGRLSINASPSQFLRSDVATMIGATLSEIGFDARRLDLEITESLFDEARTDILLQIQNIRRLGVHIAMDDFGTGYSSLAQLTKLPIDKLKIDQRFVRGMNDSKGRILLETVIALGKLMDLDVVVEGVETEAEWAALKSCGCDMIQGYLFGKPQDLPVPAPYLDVIQPLDPADRPMASVA